MKPRLVIASSDDAVLRSIVSCVSDIDCSKYFDNEFRKSQSEAPKDVTGFQKFASSVLADSIPYAEWSVEHCPSLQYRDRIDIFGKGNGFIVAIELDAARADQVAKKFVSRMAILPPTNIYFISLCYPGTKAMDTPECEKYFNYCSGLALRMHNHYAGFIIG